MNELDYLIDQLNLIIGFLDVADEDIYEKIKNHDKLQLGLTIDELYKNNYDNFRIHITNSALILGFTHFEDFINKMVVKILTKNSNENKLKISIKKFESLGKDYKRLLADEQVDKLVFTDKIKIINKVYDNINQDMMAEIIFAKDIRNCLMHNNGIADERLKSKYELGSKIVLNSGDIHSYGLLARKFSQQLWKRLND